MFIAVNVPPHRVPACLATFKETSAYPKIIEKQILRIVCSLLRRRQRGIIFTTRCESSWIIFPIFFLFSSSHTWHLLPESSAPPSKPSPNLVCCCFSLSSPAQQISLLGSSAEYALFYSITQIQWQRITKRKLPGWCDQAHVPQWHNPQLSLAAWICFSEMSHFPTNGILPHHFFCPLLPGTRIWEKLMTEPDTEENILLASQRELMS